ncbi:MAG: hypothetical protein ABSG13_12805 [Bryobacteraceae bacterium]|jgi:hypothetical protein
MKYCFVIVALAVLHAQGQVPRLADGHPDLGSDGVWLPTHVADLAPNAAVPFQGWAKAKFLANNAMKQNDLDLRCLPPGVPRITLTARPFEIVQTPQRILFVYEGGAHVWRQVWMDGRTHPKDPNPDWLGDSIGHWEGETLVVDAVGFNDKTWLDDAGHPHTERLHVIEKYTRTGAASMKYEVTIDDPGAYTKPWTSSSSLSFRPGEKLAEDICLDKISK